MRAFVQSMSIYTLATRRALLAGVLGISGSATTAVASGKTFFVSQTRGNDHSDGLSPMAAFASLERASLALAPGAALLLARGDSWDEMLQIRTKGVTVGAFGIGALPRISGAGRRHGILVQANGVKIHDLDIEFARNAIYAHGRRSSVSVFNSVLHHSGSGIVAGYGGLIDLISDCECHSCILSLGAGDGVQISEDALDAVTAIDRLRSYGNEKSGINIKNGSVRIYDSAFFGNGECGVLGQISAKEIILKKSRIIENNKSDNGTFNMALEDSVKMVSVGNLFANPAVGNSVCNNINLSGASRLTTICDEFIENVPSANIGSTIRLDFRNQDSSLIAIHASIFKRSNGWLVDAYGCAGSVKIKVINTIADAKLSGGIRVSDENSRVVFQSTALNVDQGRLYIRAQDGIAEKPLDRPEGLIPIPSIEDSFDLSGLAKMELVLKQSSVGRGSGAKMKTVNVDPYGNEYGEMPNLGARA